MGVPDTSRLDYRRRKAYHALVWTHVATIDWDMVLENLDKATVHVRGDLCFAAIDRWREIILNHDLAALDEAFTADTDEADLMRSISPFAGVLTQEERLTVIRETRRSNQPVVFHPTVRPEQQHPPTP